MKLALLLPWFGRWPVWLPAFLRSCETNPGVDWIVFTDCDPVAGSPPNVKFEKCTLRDVVARARAALDMDLDWKKPYKLCDYRPAFGLIFARELEPYDFWGFCDLDIVWGRIRHFFPDRLLETHDILTTRKGQIAGHLCLLRNSDRVNRLCLDDPEFRKAALCPDHVHYDETGFTRHVATEAAAGKLRVYWPKFLSNYAREKTETPGRLPALRNKYLWEDGRLYDLTDDGKDEILYLHFMTWKHMQSCDFRSGDAPRKFFISYSHISTGTGSPLAWRWKSRIRMLRDSARDAARQLKRRLKGRP